MRVLVVGGSIAGLSAAHVLRRLGVETTVLERSDGALLDRGAGLGLDMPRLRAVLGPASDALPACIELHGRTVHAMDASSSRPADDPRPLREPGRHLVASWQHLYDALRRGLGPVVQTGVEVTSLSRRAGGWQLGTHDGRVLHADVVVGADGHRSVVRRHLDPHAVPQYAGYLLWRGLIDADTAGPQACARFLDGHLHLIGRPGHHLVVYEVPAARPGGARRLNWGWYAATPEERQRALARRAGLPAEALIVPPTRLHATDRDGIVALAATTWPAPWPALVAGAAETGGLFVNAIHELVSLPQDDMPAVLLGDAAHLLSPITGSGAGLAMQDALALGRCWSRAGEAVGGDRPDPAALAAAMIDSHRAAQAALLRSRAWARDRLGAVPAAQAHPADEECP